VEGGEKCRIALALASRAASASAAIARCSWTGRRASLLQNKKVHHYYYYHHFFSSSSSLGHQWPLCFKRLLFQG